jgi:hypothetical protein
MAETIKFGPFTGITNRKKRYALRDEDAKTNALWNAENVINDITGRLQRRAGYTLTTALTTGDSLWCDGANMFYRNNGYLYRDGVLLEAVSGRCTFERFPGGGVIYSDSTVLRYVSGAGVASRLAPARPSAAVVDDTPGDLQPADYIVAVVGVDSAGVEGPSSAYVQYTLESTGGLLLTLPTLPDGAESFNIYVSGPNGEVLTLHGNTQLGSYTIDSYAENRAISTGGLLNMPAGDIVRIHNGRLLVAAGRVLYVSEAYNYGVYDPTLGSFVFPDDVALVVPLENGVYIAADKTYWAAGNDIRTAELIETLPYGALQGSDARSETSKEVAWMSPKGLVIADATGAAKNVQERALAINETGSRAATLYFPDEDRIVTTTNG